MANEVQRLHNQLGSDDLQTADARARFESELQNWQRSAQQAVEREDFKEYERLSQVVHRLQSLMQSLDVPKPPGRVRISLPANPGAADGDSNAPSEDIGAPKKGGEKRSKKSKHRDIQCSGGTPEASGWGDAANAGWGPAAANGWPGTAQQYGWNPVGQITAGGADTSLAAAWHGGAVDAGTTHGGEWQGGVSDTGAAHGGAWHGIAESAATAWGPGAIPPTDSSGAAWGPSSMPSTDGSNGGGWGGWHAGPSAAHHAGDAAAYGSPPLSGAAGEASGSAKDIGRCAQLEAQVHLLQQNNHAMQEQLSRAHDQLNAALQQLKKLQQPETEDDAHGTMKDLNMELQRELNEVKRNRDLLNERVGIVEARCAEQESSLTETRQRLFNEQRRCTRLEDDLQSQAALHTSIEDKLLEEHSLHEGTKQELLSLRHAFKTTAVHRGRRVLLAVL